MSSARGRPSPALSGRSLAGWLRRFRRLQESKQPPTGTTSIGTSRIIFHQDYCSIFAELCTPYPLP
ncbi:hypothetical protein MC885_016970 [Smutsia gigantea]|nr:hypothetical protein MC885_016970 [Smutsia gigantea]